MEPVTAGLIMTGAGVAGGLLSKKKQVGLSRGDIEYLIAQRQREIGNFANSLAEARMRYTSQLRNLSDLTYRRFVPQAEAGFAGRGLSVTGGAFQSALAKRAAELEAQGYVSAADMERQDLMNVENLRGQAFGLGLSAQMQVQPPQDPYGQLWGQLAGAGLTTMFQPRLDEGQSMEAPSLEYGAGDGGGLRSLFGSWRSLRPNLLSEGVDIRKRNLYPTGRPTVSSGVYAPGYIPAGW